MSNFPREITYLVDRGSTVPGDPFKINNDWWVIICCRAGPPVPVMQEEITLMEIVMVSDG